MRKATSSDGEYRSFSIAMTVCRVTPTRSASACCVIWPASRRNCRMRLVMRGFPLPKSDPAPVVQELAHVLPDFGNGQPEQQQVCGNERGVVEESRNLGVRAGPVSEYAVHGDVANRERDADAEQQPTHPFALQFDQTVAFVF